MDRPAVHLRLTPSCQCSLRSTPGFTRKLGHRSRSESGSSWVRFFERHQTTLRRAPVELPPCSVAILLAGFIFAGDRLKLAREASRPLPPANAPNILLIVLDTVRADRLSLYGYGRPTTPNLERLSKRGIRFDRARATAPWTLASHASLFTGRWPHELGEEWMTPLRGGFPMLAEYLGSRGYATAGFVANVLYCSRNTGLARGFTHYEDYVLEKLDIAADLRPGRTQATTMIAKLIAVFDISPTLSPVAAFENRWFVINQRKDAASINGSFSQLASRSERAPPSLSLRSSIYLTPMRSTCCLRESRIVSRKILPTPDEYRAVYERWQLTSTSRLLPRPCITLARDSYDDCLGISSMSSSGCSSTNCGARGVLDQTLDHRDFGSW